MMIPILTDYYAPGYLPAAGSRTIPPYLPNASLAVRRKLIEELGGYDGECSAGEDADLCARASRAGWAQYFEPKARVLHEPRSNLGSLIRQWFWYGSGGSRFFIKQQKKPMEIYLNLSLVPRMYRYRRRLSLSWFPVPVMLFVSSFLLLHMLALAGLLTLLAGFYKVGFGLLLSCILLPVFLYCRTPLKRLSGKELLIYAGITYLINWTCIVSSFWAGLKLRRILVFPGI
jgi:cellulose synthase/poly-beta-1,6-N-acetylglucosamine synthase-like glycosyltransferase